MNNFSVQNIREAIIAALPPDTSLHGSPPDIKHLYIPPGHTKALRSECNLVVGTRGVGKSTWAASLGDAELRKTIGATVHELERTEVHIAYSENINNTNYPTTDTFWQIRSAGIPSVIIWKTIVARKLDTDKQIPVTNWLDSATWVRDNPEPLGKIMSAKAEELKSQNKRLLFVFDAIDRLSDDWSLLDESTKALLQTALWLKPFQFISAKVFLREDQIERKVTEFPDSSKLLATLVDLKWSTSDLHGLLWQHLINAPDAHGNILRNLFNEHHSGQQNLFDNIYKSKQRWELPNTMKTDDAVLKKLFEALAGPWMGTDMRRGVPYHWSVSHLEDGKKRTSPRSFLAAIREAAEDSKESKERYPNYKFPLHYESIKRGIQKASQNRVNEIKEDYPWVPIVMEALSGLNVPCDYEQILERWNSEYNQTPVSIASNKLPPEYHENGWYGVREVLIRIGIFLKKEDRRIDMPDLYRVGFSLGRKGGVRPRPLQQ